MFDLVFNINFMCTLTNISNFQYGTECVSHLTMKFIMTLDLRIKEETGIWKILYLTVKVCSFSSLKTDVINTL